METALRVLSAITEHCEPDPADVQEVKRLSPLMPPDTPLDEIACALVSQALKQRATTRAKATGAN